MTADVELLPLQNPTHPTHTFGPLWSAEQMQAYARACVAHATAAKDAEIEALRAEVAALKSENEMLHEALKDADDELDRLDEDMDTCDHSVGVCTCSYWNMRQKMKAARGMGGLSND